jgi:hypothetical protein
MSLLKSAMPLSLIALPFILSGWGGKIYFLALFEKYVNKYFWGIIRRLAQPHPAARIFPRTTSLQEILPAPLLKGGFGGRFQRRVYPIRFPGKFQVF